MIYHDVHPLLFAISPNTRTVFIQYHRELFDGGENIIGSLLEQLTGGLADISSGGIPDFSGGPLGEIQGVLDGFGLNLTSMFEEFKSYYDDFKSDILSGGSEYQALVNLKPISLPRFSGLLQLGSKLPSVQYSPQLTKLLWDKLQTTFSSTTYNGVKIPDIPLGETFKMAYPTRGDFPGKIMMC